MDISELIIKQINKKKELRVADIVKLTGFSRMYINRFFRKLREAGRIVLLGKANQARYVLAQPRDIARLKAKIRKTKKIIANKNLSEDKVLNDIERETSIFNKLPKNVVAVLEYAFTEILNNAIEHSLSKMIEVRFEKNDDLIRFDIIDHGIGIFKNIMAKRKLKSELAAIQDLLKGKQTTAPATHSGEGIFFTSKAADNLSILSGQKKLVFNNLISDVFINDIKKYQGTKVIFTIRPRAKTDLAKIFRTFSGSSYEFSKTEVDVKLYKIDTVFISRSQARRLISGLDKFKHIILDFQDVATIGQAFADEIFRVWQNRNSPVKIEIKNANENVAFMIARARG